MSCLTNFKGDKNAKKIVTARKMFKELGFKYKFDKENNCQVYYKNHGVFEQDRVFIYFDLTNKYYTAYYEFNYQLCGRHTECLAINLELNNIIQFKMKELGWLDEMETITELNNITSI